MANEKKILEALHRLPNDADLALLWFFDPDGIEGDDDGEYAAFLREQGEGESFYGLHLLDLEDGESYDGETFSQLDQEFSLYGSVADVLDQYADLKETYPDEAEAWVDELDALCHGEYEKLPEVLKKQNCVVIHAQLDALGGALNLYDDLIQPYYEKAYEAWKKDRAEKG